jgi:hypothetical protein
MDQEPEGLNPLGRSATLSPPADLRSTPAGNRSGLVPGPGRVDPSQEGAAWGIAKEIRKT